GAATVANPVQQLSIQKATDYPGLEERGEVPQDFAIPSYRHALLPSRTQNSVSSATGQANCFIASLDSPRRRRSNRNCARRTGLSQAGSPQTVVISWKVQLIAVRSI